MKTPNLQKLLLKWQQRLRLRDWDITISYVHRAEMEEGDLAKTTFSTRYHYAHIKILYPAENTHHHPLMHNIELTVIHELLHLHITPLGNHDREVEELCVETLAKALLDL